MNNENTTLEKSTLPGREPTHEEIAARAHDLWERQGRPLGFEQENWTEAERQLRREFSRALPPPAAARASDSGSPRPDAPRRPAARAMSGPRVSKAGDSSASPGDLLPPE